MKRVATPELLDDDLGTPAEVAVSLNDLRHINQWFGGTRTTITLLRQIARSPLAVSRHWPTPSLSHSSPTMRGTNAP